MIQSNDRMEYLMRTVHVIAGLEESDGGPSMTLPALWTHLAKSGVEVHAHTTGTKSSISFPVSFAARAFPHALKYSPTLSRAILDDLSHADLCHNHGCWLYPNWMAAAAARRLRKPLVISPIGHMDEWSLRHHGWRKKIIRWLVEAQNWRYGSAFVAKSDMEADQLRRLGMDQPIRVIPNGLDPSEWKSPASPETFLEKFPALRQRRLLLFLSRIHPKKGLPMLLETWKQLAGAFPDWHLVVAGDMEISHATEIREQVSLLDLKDRVTFTARLQGSLKRSALAAASVFVLPSHSENFGQAILEALASGLPVITTKNCPWSGIEKHHCGWWIPREKDCLKKAMSEALEASPGDLRSMGSRAHDWVLQEFDWKTIAIHLRDLYSKVLAR